MFRSLSAGSQEVISKSSQGHQQESTGKVPREVVAELCGAARLAHAGARVGARDTRDEPRLHLRMRSGDGL